ncbi:MAG: hypothetical protein EOO38_28650 [Cytophagaceae bacterium]|nr:MAG: hypothetical protein EOO38_28650 [Cytophagaceae bacterium]
MGDDNDNEDYKVGRGKPPKHTRFVKGKSGNPPGRPKKKTRITSIEDLLNSEVTLNVNGKKVRMRMEEAIYLILKQKLLAGNMQVLFFFLKRMVPKEPADNEIIKNLLKEWAVEVSFVESQHEKPKDVS